MQQQQQHPFLLPTPAPPTWIGEFFETIFWRLLNVPTMDHYKHARCNVQELFYNYHTDDMWRKFFARILLRLDAHAATLPLTRDPNYNFQDNTQIWVQKIPEGLLEEIGKQLDAATPGVPIVILERMRLESSMFQHGSPSPVGRILAASVVDKLDAQIRDRKALGEAAKAPVVADAKQIHVKREITSLWREDDAPPSYGQSEEVILILPHPEFIKPARYYPSPCSKRIRYALVLSFLCCVFSLGFLAGSLVIAFYPRI